MSKAYAELVNSDKEVQENLPEALREEAGVLWRSLYQQLAAIMVTVEQASAELEVYAIPTYAKANSIMERAVEIAKRVNSKEKPSPALDKLQDLYLRFMVDHRKSFTCDQAKWVMSINALRRLEVVNGEMATAVFDVSDMADPRLLTEDRDPKEFMNRLRAAAATNSALLSLKTLADRMAVKCMQFGADSQQALALMEVKYAALID